MNTLINYSTFNHKKLLYFSSYLYRMLGVNTHNMIIYEFA